MTEYLDWSTKDEYVKEEEVKLHASLHKRKSAKPVTKKGLLAGRRQWRVKVLDKSALFTGTKIKGKVLDVGCGDGWSSAYLAAQKQVDVVYAMECNVPAVESLIPKAFKAYDVPKDKYKAVLGTFNNIPIENEFDFVVAMGALHHSSNLLNTMEQCAKALKPGGWLIASEPCLPNSTTNHEYMKRYTSMKNFHGIKSVREDERSDHFFRLCEWEVAAAHAGFDAYPFLFDKVGKEIFDGKKGPYNRFKIRVFKATFASCEPDRLMLLCQKPKKKEEYIPHVWSKQDD